MKSIDFKAYCQIVVDCLNETADDLKDATEKMKQVAEIVTLSTLILTKSGNVKIQTDSGTRDLETISLAQSIADRVEDEVD